MDRTHAHLAEVGGVLGDARRLRVDVIHKPVNLRLTFRVEVVHDQHQALGAFRDAGPGEGRAGGVAVAGVLDGKFLAILHRRTRELEGGILVGRLGGGDGIAGAAGRTAFATLAALLAFGRSGGERGQSANEQEEQE